MKYIDRFNTLDDFLNSEMQQMTGARIATIEGFDLPILKKRVKTVLDPSTNEEVEVLKDMFLTPIGSEEREVVHNFSFMTQSSYPEYFNTSRTIVWNYYNYDTNGADNSPLTSSFGVNIGEYDNNYILLDNEMKQWGWTVTIDNSNFSTNFSQNGYSLVPTNTPIRTYLNSWEAGGYYILHREYAKGVIPKALKNELISRKNAQSLTQDTFEIHDNACTLHIGTNDIPISLNFVKNYYYSQYPQGFDTNNIQFEDVYVGTLSNNYCTSFEYDSLNREITVHVSNYDLSPNGSIVPVYVEIKPKSVDGYTLSLSPSQSCYSFVPTDVSNEHTIANSGLMEDVQMMSDCTLEYDLTSTLSGYIPVSNFDINTSVVVPNTIFSNIHLKLVYGNGGLEPLAIPSGTTTIDSMVLSSAYPDMNDRPTEFSIPEGVTRIESDAFWGWTINNISFPSTLEFVGSRAFDLYLGQDTITSVTLPANCKYFDNSFGGAGYASFANMSSDPMTANTVWTPITVTGGQVYSCRLSDVLTSEQKTTLKNGGFYSGIWMQLDPNYSTNITQKVTIADFDNIWGPAPENPDPMMSNLYFGRGDALLDSWPYLKEVHFPTYMTGEFGDNVFNSCRSLNTVTGIDNITSIGKNCFRNTNISSFTLPTSVTTIGQGAFSWEYLSTAPLTSFTIPQGSMLNKIEGNAFAGQNNLLSITLPAGCQYSASSFHNNTVVTGGIQGWDMHDQAHYGQIVEDNTVTVDSYKFNNNSTDFRYGVNYYFPSSVTTIGDFAFNNCQNLSNITLHSGITSIGENAFANCWSLAGTIALPSTLTTLGSSAFWNCSQLSVTFPLTWSVTSIPDNCFSGCGFNSSSSITIPDGVTSIGNNAFYNCSGLTSVTLPNSLTSVGSGAFAGTNLTAVTLPNGCTWYETSFPAGCTVTSDTTATPVIADLSNYSASGSLSSDYFQMNFGYNNIYSKVIIPEGVTELQTMGSAWFPNSTQNNIKEVTMPSTLTTVGNAAFQNMVNLETLDTQYLQSIPESLFQGDTKLFRNSAPTLNANVTNIGDNAFRGTMKNVTTLDLSASNIMSIGTKAFAETGLTSVTLPSGCTYYLSSFPAGCTVTGGSAFTYDETDVYNSCGVEIFPTGTTSVTSDPLSMYYTEKSQLTSLTVPASITTIGGFNYYNNLNTLTFQHTSSDPLYINSWAFQGDDIRSLSIPAGCTNIQESAFAGNQNLSSVTFDSNAVSLSIDKGAFANTALTAVTLPSVATYWPNSFPAGCTVTGGTIGEYPFYIDSMNSSMSYSYNNSWTKVYFQSDVTSTMSNQFEHCENIIEVEFNNSNSLIIQSNMFKDCERLATATFNGAAVTIYAGAFSGTALTAVTLPIGSTYEAGAFPVGCVVTVLLPNLTFSASPEALGSTTIDDGETELSGTVTLDGNSLTWSQLSYDSTTGASVQYLDNGSYVTDSGVVVNVSYDSAGSKWKAEWYGCTGNRSYQIEIPFTYTNNGNTYTGSYFMTFTEPAGSVLVTENQPDRSANGQGYRGDTSITKLVVAEGVTSLGESAFNGCTNLVSVKLPSTLTKMGLGCFLGTKISSIVIPDGCHGISDVSNDSGYGHLGYGTFQDCVRLTSVYIPNTISCIDTMCFSGCKNLLSVELPYGCTKESTSFHSVTTFTYRAAPSA